MRIVNLNLPLLGRTGGSRHIPKALIPTNTTSADVDPGARVWWTVAGANSSAVSMQKLPAPRCQSRGGTRRGFRGAPGADLTADPKWHDVPRSIEIHHVHTGTVREDVVGGIPIDVASGEPQGGAKRSDREPGFTLI